MYFPSRSDFDKNLRDGKTQLVWTWVPADLETPVSAYLKLTRDQKNSFLLESVEGGATLGRYSAIGLEPDLIWNYQSKSSPPRGEDLGEGENLHCAQTITYPLTPSLSPKGRGCEDKPLDTLRRLIKESRIDIVADEIPPMGPSGLFGYMGYDMVRLVEDIPDSNPDTLNIPDSIMIRPTVMVIFDNVQSRMCLVTPVRETSGDHLYDDAVRRLENILERLADPLPSTELHHATQLQNPLPVTSNMSEADYAKMVNHAIEYIRAGDIFQVVLGQRFSTPFDLPAFSLYRSLRRLNPSPFLFYFNFGGFQLVGSSPEILVRVRNKRVTIRPIAGTRKRGMNTAEDNALAEELLADPKERAEHLMLLDLGRNDVGRVAKIGTVQVTDQFIIERYSHVMHIVSNVEGELRDDLDSLDALFAGFPAGTVSGAPKVRAMEIIDELEPLRRSYYGGCVGYLDGNGELDSCIALRTSIVKDGTLHIQASAGIVADSKAAFEHKECVNKAKAIVQAADESVALSRQAMSQKH